MTDSPTPPPARVDHFPALDERLMSALHTVLDDAMDEIHHGTHGWSDEQVEGIRDLNGMMWDSAKAKKIWWARNV